MAITSRTVEIQRLVRLHGSCSITDLAEQLQVSDETVRRNVKPLVAKGLVLKVHGGIMLPDRIEELPFQKRMQENKELKQRIGALAARQIKDGDSLILDGGATTVYVALALALPGHRNLHVVTNSTEIARTLAPRNDNHVYMAGGDLRADDASAFGTQAQAFIRQFQVRHAILSMGAINLLGFMDQHPCEAELAQAAIAQAERVIVVADHTKFGRDGSVKVCDSGDIDMLITDAPPPASLAKRLAESDIEVLVAGAETAAMRTA